MKSSTRKAKTQANGRAEGPASTVTLKTIQQAAKRIRDSIYLSPFMRSETFSQLTGNSLFLKLENLQMTGSFKERGALNKILLLTPDERRRGVIAASAGNHAQAVAYHATKRGIASQIVMPLTTPLVKVSATRGHGAEVILFGANYDEACQEALRRCAEQCLDLHPSLRRRRGNLRPGHARHRNARAGAGSGRGGDSHRRRRTYRRRGLRGEGNESENESDRRADFEIAFDESGGRAKSVVTLPAEKTIADGIAVRAAGVHTFPLVRKYVDEIVTVDEEEIANAILLLLEKEKTFTEGAGAVAAAAVLNRKTALAGKKLGVLISAGNIDVTLLARIIERGLVKDGRLVRLRIHLPDHPGALVRLSTVIAEHKVNIVETQLQSELLRSGLRGYCD